MGVPQPAVNATNTPVAAGRPLKTQEQFLQEYSSKARTRGIVAWIFATAGWVSNLVLRILDTQTIGEKLLTSLFTLLGFGLQIPGFIIGIIGLVTALKFRSRNGGQHNGSSKAGMIFSIIALVVIVVTLIILIVFL